MGEGIAFHPLSLSKSPTLLILSSSVGIDVKPGQKDARWMRQGAALTYYYLYWIYMGGKTHPRILRAYRSAGG